MQLLVCKLNKRPELGILRLEFIGRNACFSIGLGTGSPINGSNSTFPTISYASYAPVAFTSVTFTTGCTRCQIYSDVATFVNGVLTPIYTISQLQIYMRVIHCFTVICFSNRFFTSTIQKAFHSFGIMRQILKEVNHRDDNLASYVVAFGPPIVDHLSYCYEGYTDSFSLWERIFYFLY